MTRPPAHTMRRLLPFGLVLGVAVCGTVACQVAEAQSLADAGGPRRTTDIELVSDSQLIAGSIQPRVTLDGMLARYEVVEHDRHALVAAVQRVFDVRRVRVGQHFTIDRLLDGRVRSLDYEIDGDRRLRVLADESRAFTANIETIPKEVTVDAVEGRISKEAPSLTQALDAVGERLDLALAMADVFSGELDFSSELQPGDEFRLVVERHTRQGEVVGYGAILAAEFVASGRVIRAYPVHAEWGKAGLLRRGRALTEALLPEVAAQVRAAHHLAVLERPPASHPQVHARPQWRRLLGPLGAPPSWRWRPAR
jgi:hypothetical protein